MHARKLASPPRLAAARPPAVCFGLSRCEVEEGLPLAWLGRLRPRGLKVDRDDGSHDEITVPLRSLCHCYRLVGVSSLLVTTLPLFWA